MRLHENKQLFADAINAEEWGRAWHQKHLHREGLLDLPFTEVDGRR